MADSYIIVTPVFNEQKYIAQTIKGVLAQSLLPQVWIIVDDDSTDQSAEIIQSYARRYPWIRYVHRNKEIGQTYYESNVRSILLGLQQANDMDYSYLAILDADMVLPNDYYEKIFKCFASDPKLGIASGVYVDNVKGKHRKILNDRRSTPKSLMVFRRHCYTEVDGFIPMKYGCEDTCACFKARMKGWKTWSYPDLVAVHNKPIGTGHAKNILRIRFSQGLGDWGLAFPLLFMIFKSLRRGFKEYPFLLSGIARLMGYCYGHFLSEKRQIPEELVRYISKEQRKRLLMVNKIPKHHRVLPCKEE